MCHQNKMVKYKPTMVDREKGFVNNNVCLQMAHEKHTNDEDQTKHVRTESIGHQHNNITTS